MKPDNSYIRRLAKLRLAGLYVAAMVLIVVILSAFWGPLPSLPKQNQQGKASNELMQEHLLLTDVDFLHEQFKKVQEAPAGESQAARNRFQSAMDSIERKSFSYGSANKKKLYDIISSFTTAINNQPAVYNAAKSAADTKLQNDVVAKNSQVTDLENQLKGSQNIILGIQQDFSRVQKELQIKDGRIADLENQLKSSSKGSSVSQQDYSNIQKELQRKNNRISELEQQLKDKKPAESSASSKELDKLRSDNKYLSLALSSQFKQTNSLTETNKQLKAEIEKLKKRQ